MGGGRLRGESAQKVGCHASLSSPSLLCSDPRWAEGEGGALALPAPAGSISRHPTVHLALAPSGSCCHPVAARAMLPSAAERRNV